jgi:ribosomal protein L22
MTKPWAKLRGRKESAMAPNVSSNLDDPRERAKFINSNFSAKTEGSIFQDEIDGANKVDERKEATGGPIPVVRTRDNTAMALDPDPGNRIRWERKKVMQLVRRGGRLTRQERILATEREHTHKSEFLPTSVKKLVMLSRQIAGKTVDDAITQMQWSKKKMAREMRFYLEEARDLAIAQRGMGLGKVNGELFEKPRKIQTVDGKWIEISDPTQMYVAQSWVGRGPIRGKELDYKGRGRSGIIEHPSTSTLCPVYLPRQIRPWYHACPMTTRSGRSSKLFRHCLLLTVFLT